MVLYLIVVCGLPGVNGFPRPSDAAAGVAVVVVDDVVDDGAVVGDAAAQ